MNAPRKASRFWLWVAVLLLLEVVVITVWSRWRGVAPSYETSELYRQYAGTEGLTVAYFKDYRINDSIFVDVTYLQASTDSLWEGLCEDLNIRPQPPDQAALHRESGITIKLVPKCDYTEPTDTTDVLNNDLRSVDWKRRTVCFFHIKTIEQKRAIMRLQVRRARTKEPQVI